LISLIDGIRVLHGKFIGVAGVTSPVPSSGSENLSITSNSLANLILGSNYSKFGVESPLTTIIGLFITSKLIGYNLISSFIAMVFSTMGEKVDLVGIL
jgi:hypothetical protein